MNIINFTPYSALIGGVLIGLAAAILLLFNGRIFGITGIIGGIKDAQSNDLIWRILVLIGLIAGALIAYTLLDTPQTMETRPTYLLVIGGLLTGLGARLGSGCTSGHGVCGISRFSQRSIIATITFISSGIITVTLLRVLGF